MSGLNGRPGKSVRSQGLREFESLLLRHLKGNMSIKIIPLVEALNGRHEKYCNTMFNHDGKLLDQRQCWGILVNGKFLTWDE